MYFGIDTNSAGSCWKHTSTDQADESANVSPQLSNDREKKKGYAFSRWWYRIFLFSHLMGKIPILTDIFQMG